MEINEYNIQDYFKQNEIKQDITNALIEDRVEAFFQPIYSTKKKKFTTAEALMRIRQENGTLLPPNLFIPVAESTGLIMPLGERIFEKVCRFLKESNIRELGIEYIEINLSIVQCEQDDLAERLIQIMKQYEIPASWINLEITESATYNSKRKVLKNISKLRDHGIEFSLDDFGKGQSNLMYMVEMPVSIVKLDMDLSKAYFSIPKAKNVVDSVAEMAHGMGLKLVAEGIETKEELDGIIEPGIDYIQGFYFSKPLPEAEFLEFIAEKNA
ncbi:MAG: EAL domain-containing protein [Lachnospiraceae bacterium]|nr:EAL domain-containing protein [Lachnospiraceae bacterium]